MTGELGTLRNQLSTTEQAVSGRMLRILGDTGIKPEAESSFSKNDVSRKQ